MVYEEFGTGFTLLAFGVEDPVVRAFESAAASANLPFHTVRDAYDGGREAYEHRLVLVRPDQYVAWTGDAPPADLPALLAKVAGR